MGKRFLFIVSLIALCFTQLYAQTEASDRMKQVVSTLASDIFMGREAGTDGERLAAAEIAKQFRANGLSLLYPDPGQDFFFVYGKDTLASQNVVAIVEGSDPLLKHEYIVVGAHYDHLGHSAFSVNSRDSVLIFRGADDNASGIAVMLEVARMAAMQPFSFRRSIIFAAFGAEEIGLNGSWYFVNRGFAYIDKVAFMVNLDMVGRGADRNDVSAFTITPNMELLSILKDVADQPAMISPDIQQGSYFLSDHQPFALKGIPVVLFTTGIHDDYHSVNDLPVRLNYRVMEDLSQYTLELLKHVANMDINMAKTIFATTEEKNISEDGVYEQNQVDRRATYLRGDERSFMTRWVYKYLKYPREAVDRGIQGRVVIEFIVEKTGEITNVQVVRSVDELLDQEAIKVISASPKWRPATIEERPVRVKTSVPVEFKLTKDRSIRLKK